MEGRPQTALQAALSGAWRFALVSVGGFGVWAAEKYILPRGSSEVILYLACLVAFIVLAQVFLVPLVHGPNARSRFNRAFVPGFIGYAVIWSGFWFAMKFGLGEWLGSIAGCSAFGWIVGRSLGARSGFMGVILVLIVFHGLGYFLGGELFYSLKKSPDMAQPGMLLWGVCYGLGFGSGIGYAFHVFQRSPQRIDPQAD